MRFWLDKHIFRRAIIQALRRLGSGAGIMAIAAETRFQLRSQGHVLSCQILPQDAHVEAEVQDMSFDGAVLSVEYEFVGGDGKPFAVRWYRAWF